MKDNNVIAIVVAAILLVVAIVCLYFSYNENSIKKENVNTKDGAAIAEEGLNADKYMYVSEVKKEDKSTYLLKGVVGEKYIITEDEYDYIRNGEPLIVDSVKYYYEWSDKYNEYIYVSKKNKNVFYVEKIKGSDKYQVKQYDATEEVYRESEDGMQILLNKNIKCILSNGSIKTLEEYVKKNKFGKIKLQYKDGKCDSIVVY